MRSPLLRGLVVLAVIAATSPFAHAGRSCEQRPPSAAAVSRAMQLAEHTATRLTQSGASVVVIARAGQNLSEYGVRYSHLGFAYREGEGDATLWRVVHKLNQCGSARASIYRQGLGEFFLDDLWEYEAAVVVLAPQAQAHLRSLLADNVAVARLDTPAYSMVAYPWSDRYQQSNQWAIETLAMSQDMMASPSAVPSRERAQAWLKLQNYTPGVLTLGPMKRLGARATRANIAFDDHPNEKRFADRIETVTVDSVFGWLGRSGLGGPVTFVR